MKNFRSPAAFARLSLALCAVLPIAAQSQQPTTALRETVVGPTRFPEPARVLPSGVSVVTAQEIERSGAATINEALVRILGIVGRQDFFGGGEYNLDLRGFGSTADQNQVIVVDGVRLSEADIGGTRLSGIPIESVERIEVLRGAGAVLYGEGATAGVIVITTKAGAGVPRANGATLHAGAGSFRTRDLRASANVGAGGFSLDASAQKRRSDNHRDNFRSDLDAASATAQWAGDRARVGVRLARDDLDSLLPGPLTPAQFAANPRQSTTPGDRASLRGERVALFGEARLGDWEVGGDVQRRTKRLRSLNFGLPFDYDIETTQASWRARHSARFGDAANSLVLGTDLGHWTRERLGAFGSTATQANHALYARDDFTFAGGTRLTAGWRTERFRKDDTTFGTSPLADRVHAWELGASQPLGRDVTAYARVGRSYRLAYVDEFNFTTPGVNLRPQTSHDTELGARWVHEGGSIDARLFRSAITDEIGFDPNAVGPFGPGGANVNLDPTRRQGVEVDATQALTRELGLRVNAAVRRATFRAGPNAGREVPLAPRGTLAVRLDWAFAPQQRLTGGVNWVSSQHPDYANACTVPAYTTADLRYAYEWGPAELSLGVANLFDKRYYTQAFGCAAGLPAAIYPEPGRAFQAAVRVKF